MDIATVSQDVAGWYVIGAIDFWRLLSGHPQAESENTAPPIETDNTLPGGGYHTGRW